MKHRGMKILSLLLTLAMVVGLVPGMGLTAYAAHYTSLIDGQVLHVGDTFTPETTYYASFSTFSGSYAPYKLVRVNVGEGGTFVESDDGKYYTFYRVNYSEYYNVTIEATATSDGLIVTRNGVLVNFAVHEPTIPVTGVTLDPSSATLTVGGIQKLTASVLPENATDKTVLWNVRSGGDKVKLYSDENCQTEITQDKATGTLTVFVKGVSAGGATVEVTSNDDLNKYANCTVTVNAPAASKYTVTYAANNGSGDTQVYGPYDAGTTYTVEGCSFAAPEGKVFDCWLGSDGSSYRVGTPVVLNANLILTAQWKDTAPAPVPEAPQSIGPDIVFIGGAEDTWEYVGGPQHAWKASLAPLVNGSATLVLTTGEGGSEMNIYPQTSIRVIPNPDPGYTLDKIVWSLIDGSASYDITEAQTFVMPAMDVVVYVTFRPVG